MLTIVRKLDKVSKAPIAGAEFELTYAEGGYVDDANGHLSSKGRYTTNDMGEIRLSVTGTVVVKEVAPAPGYVIDLTTQIQTVKVNPADTQTLTFYNEPLCSLTLTKRDSVTGKPVPGTEFTLKDGNGNIIGRYTTGEDGTVTVTGLIPGSTVVAVETKVPQGVRFGFHAEDHHREEWYWQQHCQRQHWRRFRRQHRQRRRYRRRQ